MMVGVSRLLPWLLVALHVPHVDLAPTAAQLFAMVCAMGSGVGQLLGRNTDWTPLAGRR